MNDSELHRYQRVTELERRVIDAARVEQPPSQLSERMAAALGIPASSLLAHREPLDGSGQGSGTRAGESDVGGHPAPGPQGVPEAGLIQGLGGTAPAATGWGAWVPWVVGSSIAVAVAAAALANRDGADGPLRVSLVETQVETQLESPELIGRGIPVSAPQQEQPPAPTSPEAAEHEPSPELAKPEAARSQDELSALSATIPTQRKPRVTSPLKQEIALVDSARAALRAGSEARALELVGQYRRDYPRGSFRPEARALEIEALMKLGRQAEARTLAERFLTTHRGTAIGERVARMTGL